MKNHYYAFGNLSCPQDEVTHKGLTLLRDKLTLLRNKHWLINNQTRTMHICITARDGKMDQTYSEAAVKSTLKLTGKLADNKISSSKLDDKKKAAANAVKDAALNKVEDIANKKLNQSKLKSSQNNFLGGGDSW